MNRFRPTLAGFEFRRVPRAAVRRVRRFIIRVRWLARDISSSPEKPQGALECPICHHQSSYQDFAPAVSRCIFGGGKLVRHECPQCGLIFGPQKMLSLSSTKRRRDYRAHYSCYDEGDTTQWELETFWSLDPRKSGFYLNFGCGRWSKAMKEIRRQGYQIIGFDPYAANPDEQEVINDRELLKTMRFDGIMSHNLLEHLTDPSSELAFMASLLKKQGTMAHSTECYEYRHEYSRFHLFFFTGDSLKVLSRASGLQCVGAPGKNIRIFRRVRSSRSKTQPQT